MQVKRHAVSSQSGRLQRVQESDEIVHKISGEQRNRTADLVHAKHALYQLS
jgi:hypothetical protein